MNKTKFIILLTALATISISILLLINNKITTENIQTTSSTIGVNLGCYLGVLYVTSYVDTSFTISDTIIQENTSVIITIGLGLIYYNEVKLILENIVNLIYEQSEAFAVASGNENISLGLDISEGVTARWTVPSDVALGKISVYIIEELPNYIHFKIETW